MERNVNGSGSRSAETIVRATLQAGIDLHTRVLAEQVPVIARVAEAICTALGAGGAVLLMGNGGSAATAQHIAAELVGRFLGDRPAFPALELNTDTAILTAVGNDLGFDQIFARQIAGLAKSNDIVVGISGSGNSVNVLNGLRAARKKGVQTVGFTGQGGGQLRELADYCFCVPSECASHIQEVHLAVGHAICEIVEAELLHARV